MKTAVNVTVVAGAIVQELVTLMFNIFFTERECSLLKILRNFMVFTSRISFSLKEMCGEWVQVTVTCIASELYALK